MTGVALRCAVEELVQGGVGVGADVAFCSADFSSWVEIQEEIAAEHCQTISAVTLLKSC